MRIRSMLAVALVAVCLVAGAAIFKSRPDSIRAAELRLSIQSPDNTYTVTVDGQAEPPDTEFIQLNQTRHEVKAAATKQGQPIFNNLSIYSGDGYDAGFKELYPNQRWLSESILALGQEANFSSPQQGVLSITNESKNVIPYLYVRAGKYYVFLIFDLQPDSVVKLPVHLQYWERVIGCEGKFDDGAQISFNEVNFSAKDKTTASARYCAIITKSNVAISSGDFEGSKLDGTTVPKAECSGG